jgi:polyphosphate kinase
MPVLTPIGLDPAHPFPRLLNKSLNFAVELEGRDAFGRNAGHAIVQAPRALPRVIALPEDIAGCQYGFVFSLVDSARPRWRAVWLHDSARLLPVPRDPEQ